MAKQGIPYSTAPKLTGEALEQNKLGTSQGARVQGAGGRPVRNEPANAGRVRLLAKLETIALKNTIHSRSVKNLMLHSKVSRKVQSTNDGGDAALWSKVL